MKVLDLAML